MGSGEQEAFHYTDNFMFIDSFWDLCEEGKTYLPFKEIEISFFYKNQLSRIKAQGAGITRTIPGLMSKCNSDT
jgi:hypothetical protein